MSMEAVDFRHPPYNTNHWEENMSEQDRFVTLSKLIYYVAYYWWF